MKKIRSKQFFVLSAAIMIFYLLLTLPAPQGYAYSRVLSSTSSPVYFSIEQRKYEGGSIRQAFLRTSSEALSVPEIQGMVLLPENETLSKELDGDRINDTVWKIFLKDNHGKKMILWTITLSKSRTGWLFLTPCSENRWGKIPFNISVPENILLYFSPETPGYHGVSQRNGKNVLTFAYTIRITEEGPTLVIAPPVYDSIYDITSMVAATENDSKMKFVYEMMLGDYGKMLTGKMPSREAILNFEWNIITDFEW